MNADQKLNRLINEYRIENERTAAKISDLKERLTASQNRGGSRRKSPGKAQPSYSKSFKNANGQDYFGMNDRSPVSSKHREIENPYRYQMSAQR